MSLSLPLCLPGACTLRGDGRKSALSRSRFVHQGAQISGSAALYAALRGGGQSLIANRQGGGGGGCVKKRKGVIWASVWLFCSSLFLSGGRRGMQHRDATHQGGSRWLHRLSPSDRGRNTGRNYPRLKGRGAHSAVKHDKSRFTKSLDRKAICHYAKIPN